MPTPTDINTDDIKQLRESNQRIVDALHLLEVTVTKEFGEIRGEMGRRFEHLETALGERASYTRWLATALIAPAILALAGFAFWAMFRAGEVNNRITQLEQNQPKAEIPKR